MQKSKINKSENTSKSAVTLSATLLMTLAREFALQNFSHFQVFWQMAYGQLWYF